MNDFPVLPLIATIACLLAVHFHLKARRLRKQLLFVAETLLRAQRAMHAVLTDDAAYAAGKEQAAKIKELNEQLERLVRK